MHIVLVLAVIALSAIIKGDGWKNYKSEPFQFRQDVDQYYSYLPAAFIHKDLSFEYTERYWLIENRHGKLLPKVTMGMSYMYAPFFLLGHAVALNTDFPADGYSLPYSIAVWYGTVTYMLIAMFFLIKALDLFFKKWISAVVALMLFFGTNLLHYTFTEGEMPHSYLFTIFSIVIYYTIKWHQQPRNQYLYILAFFFGIAVIIRQIEVLLLLFFVLYNVYDKKSLMNKARLISANFKAILIAGLFFLIPIIPQLVYWKVFGDEWLVYSYGDEGFYFSDPKIIDFLFSYRKGWFIYSPLMLFAIGGFFLLKNRLKALSIAIPVLTVVIIYILSSWWCWWYGGGFGMRAMVQYYAFLAFPLAAVIAFMTKRRWSAILLAPMIAFSVYYGYFYNYKYRTWTLHWDSLSKEAYWHTFMKKRFTEEEYVEFEEKLEAPDYKAARKGDR